MADEYAKIRIDVDTAAALANIKNLQRQISAFHTSMAKGSADAATASRLLQQKLINSVNATGQFTAEMKTVKTTTESFTDSLQKNKLSLNQYFRYAGGASKTFGKLFKTEFDTIGKVARERVKDLQTQYIKMGRDANGAMKAISIRPLVLDMENLATKTAIAAQKQQLLNQLLKQGSTNLLNFGKNTQWAGRQLMVGFTIPLTMFGALAAKTFMDLEKQAIRFKRVYGDMFTTTADTTKALEDIKALANEFTKYGIAVSKTMELAADAAAMGKTGADLNAQVAEATRLAVLGGVEQADALKTTISLTDAFAISAENLASKTDFLNAIENQTVTSIEDLTIAIPKAGPVIEQLGGNVEDLAFFLTAMREGGINASEGANALKSGLAALINPTGKASEMLQGLGINVKGIVEANKGDVKNLVIDFAKSLDTLDPLNRARAIEQLFGKFQFARISTLFKNVITEGNQASRVLELTKASTAELAILSERELKKVEDSPLFKFQKAIEDIKVTLVPLGEAFLKAVTPIIEFGTKILEKFNNLDEGTKSFIVTLGGLAGIIGPAFLMTFGLLANGIANIIKGFTFIKTVFNKAGSSANVLGQNVDYMTQQQIEAAAVAASLDQVHSKLVQTFTSEASAVNNLTAALTKATVAQQGFTGAGGVRRGAAKTKTTKKYASGIVSVPGPKGAGDVVPAMLTPGESIIPAEITEKYFPLIQGMIADNIPGFKKGLTPTYTNATMYLPKNINEEMARSSGTSAKGLHESIKGGGVAFAAPVAAEIASSLSGKRSQSQITEYISKNSNIKKFATNFSKIMAEETGKLTGKVNDAQFSKIAEKALRTAGLQSKIPKATIDKLLSEQTSFGQLKANPKKGRGKYERRGLFEKGVTPYMKKGSLYQAVASQLSGNPFKTLGLHLSHLTETTWKTADQIKALETSTKKLGEPGKRAAGIIAKNTKEIKNKTAAEIKNTKATKDSTKAKIQETRKAVAKNKVETKKPKPLTEKQLAAKRSMSAAKGVETRRANALAAKQSEQFAKRSAAATKGAETRRLNKLAAQEAAQPVKARPRFGAGAIGAAASVGVMGASMVPGQVGAAAQDLMMPVMMLSTMLPMLANPVGLAITAIGGLAVAAFMLDQQFKANVKKAYELETAMGAGTDAIQPLAEAAGNVTATEIMNKRRESAISPINIQPGKTTFGQTYMQQESGQALKTSVAESIKTLGRGDSIAKITNQMASAVAAGALSPEQARSIINQLSQELGDVSFGIEVNSKLISMLGPNGENLLNEPLQIRTKIIQASRAGITGAETKENIFATKGGVVKTGKKTMTGEGIGTFVAGAATALQTQQQMQDSLQLEYEQRIANAKATGDMAKASELEVTYQKERTALLKENAITTGQIQKQFAGVENQRQVLDSFGDQIKTKFKDNPLVSGMMDSLMSNLDKLDDQKEIVLRASLLSGDLDPIALNNILSGDNAKVATDIMVQFGGAEASQIFALSNLMGKKESAQFLVDVQGMSVDEMTKYVGSVQNLYNLSAFTGNSELVINTYLNDEDLLTKFNAQMTALQAAAEKGPITISVVEQLVTEGTLQPSVLEAIKTDQAYFDSLPEEQKLTYIQAMTVTANLEGDAATLQLFRAWQLEQGGKRLNVDGGIVVGGGTFAEFLSEAIGKPVTKGSEDTTAGGDGNLPSDTPTGPGAKDNFSDILKRLKEVRKRSIDAAGGAAELLRVLGGAKKITIFEGIENKLTLSGASENFTQFLMGLEESAKDTFYRITKDGEVKFTNLGKAMQKAFNAVTLGEFVLKQQKSIQESNNQRKAADRLIQAGMSSADAYEAVADANDAAAIAALGYGAKGVKVLKKIIEWAAKAKTAMLQATPQNAFDMLAGDIDLKKQRVELNFQLSTKADQDIVRLAENEIAGLQSKIDDYQAGLQEITWKESEVNKKYQERAAALNKIRNINAQVSQQRKSELSLADALSTGDIAAAARVAQEVRDQQATAELDRQEAALTYAQEVELAALKSTSGKTRAELEALILKTEKEIFAIEELRLEPAQERIRLAEQLRDIELAALDAQLLKYEDLLLKLKEAEASSKAYAENLQAALAALLAMQGLEFPSGGGGGGGSAGSLVGIKGRGAYLGNVKGPNYAGTVEGQKGWKGGKWTWRGGKWQKAAGGYISGPGSATSDSIPAMLSNGEYVIKAASVSKFGKGFLDNINAGTMPGSYAIGGMINANRIVPKFAIDNFGIDNLNNSSSLTDPNQTTIVPARGGPDNSTYSNDSVYNSYSVNVNVSTDANPNEIADRVITQIKRIDSQRVRGNRY